MPAKVWKLKKGRWGGITARGKRITITGSKKAARKLAGLTSKSRTTKSKTKSKTKKGGKRRMARRKRRGGGGKSLQRTVFKWLRIGALVANPIRIAMIPGITNSKKIVYIIQDYTGFNMEDGKFYGEALARGWGPYLMACLATYGIPKLSSIIRRL